ncbi:MAG: L-rhamnose mutarotase [Bacteroidales bacterium]|nr:L-rhamnose mutarotase [Bacteroidales bacterium]
MKTYCQTLELVNDPDVIRRYCDAHKKVWPEVVEGMKQVGIVDMKIYRRGTHVFMICNTTDDFDWNKDWERLSKLPRQAEWEAFVAECQGRDPSRPSHKKWRLMEKIFDMAQ